MLSASIGLFITCSYYYRFGKELVHRFGDEQLQVGWWAGDIVWKNITITWPDLLYSLQQGCLITSIFNVCSVTASIVFHILAYLVCDIFTLNICQILFVLLNVVLRQCFYSHVYLVMTRADTASTRLIIASSGQLL